LDVRVERRTARAGFRDLDREAAVADAHASEGHRATGAAADGYQWSGHSVQIAWSAGRTSRAKSSVLRWTFSRGMFPNCIKIIRWPTRIDFTTSISWSRTVAGLPAMTAPAPTRPRQPVPRRTLAEEKPAAPSVASTLRMLR